MMPSVYIQGVTNGVPATARNLLTGSFGQPALCVVGDNRAVPSIYEVCHV